MESLGGKLSVGFDGEDDILKAENSCIEMLRGEGGTMKEISVEEREKLEW